MLIFYFSLVLLCGDIDAVRNGNVFGTDDLCEPNYCGIQANCDRGRDEHGNAIRICSCPLGYVGNPNVTCVRGLCLHNDDCLDHLYCDQHLCKNPCTVLTCARYALCTATNHRAKCSCPNGHEGNPTEVCRYSPEQPSIQNLPDDLCIPNPCGKNAHCLYGRDQLGNSLPATCSCPINFYGNASILCSRKECQDNNDCPANLACQAYLCTNPCTVSPCATFAACRISKHKAVCSCPMGHDGDPRQECVYRPLIKDVPIVNHIPIGAYGLWKGRWIVVCTDMIYATAVTCCEDKNATLFHPKTKEDHEYMQDFRASLGSTEAIWYPIDDRKVEGTFVWQDGTAVSKEDEQNIPWAYSEVYQSHDTEIEDEDCGAMDVDGVYIISCNSGTSSVMCTAEG